MPDDPLVFVQGDTGPNPIFHLRNASPTSGSTDRDLASVASAFLRWMSLPSGATTWIIPATVATGAAPSQGYIEGLIGSQATALASAGRYGVQVVLRGPWGVETWPRDTAFPVVVTARLGSL